MGVLPSAIGLGLGWMDFQRNQRIADDQEGRRGEALDYLDQWESGYNAPDAFGGQFDPFSAMEGALGPNFNLDDHRNDFLSDLGFDPGGGFQQVLGQGVSQLFDPTEIDRVIGEFQGDYRDILGDLQGRQFDLGDTFDMLQLGDPLERERAVLSAGHDAAGQSQEAMLRQFNQQVAQSGDFDPFSASGRQAFQDRSSQQLFSDLNSTRNAASGARFGTEDANAGIRQSALAEEMAYLTGIDSSIGQLTGAGGLGGVIAGLGSDRERFLLEGRANEQGRVESAMDFWGNSLLNAEASGQNRLGAGTNLFQSVANAGLGQAELGLQGDLGALQARLGVLAPEFGTNVVQSLRDLFITGMSPHEFVESGGAQTFQYT